MSSKSEQKNQKDLVQSAMKKLTNAELKALIELGMFLEEDRLLGVRLLRKLAE